MSRPSSSARRGPRARRRALALVTALLPAAALLAAAPGSALASGPAALEAYVANGNLAGTTATLDGLSAASAASQVSQSATEAGGAQEVVVSPDDSTAYVGGPGTLMLYNAATGAFEHPDPTDVNQGYLAMSRDGSTIYITGQAGIDKLSTATGVVTTDAIPDPGNDSLNGIAVSPDGSTLYVAGEFGNNLYVINAATGAVTSTIHVGNNPFGVLLSTDGSRLYVMNSEDNTVSVISTATNTVTATVRVGITPGNPCISPDGNTLYVPNLEDATVSVISTATSTVTATILPPPHLAEPDGCAVTPDNSQVWVSYGATSSSQPGAVAAFGTSPAHPVAGQSPAGVNDPQAITFGPFTGPAPALAVTPAPAFSLTQFDASASTVPYGTITNYAWNFGDGSTANTTTPTTSHTYTTSGPFTATVTETGSVATQSTAVYDGIQNLLDGEPPAQASSAFTVPPGPGSVTGVITAANGDPLSGVTVALLTFGGIPLTSTTTDGDGFYTLAATSAPNLQLQISGTDADPDVPGQFLLSSEFNLNGGMTENIVLPALVPVSVSVTDTTGHRVAGATVSEAPEDPVVPVALFPGATAGAGTDSAAPVTTDGSGTATLFMFPTFQANLTATSGSLQGSASVAAIDGGGAAIQLPTLPAVNLTSSLSPSNYKQPVTFTAAVGANGSGGPAPTGTVTFSVDGTPQAPVTLSPSGLATMTSSSLGAGVHAVTATYSGDSVYASTSGSLNQIVLPDATTTALTSTAMPAVTGQAGSITATVAATGAGAAKPTGSVTFTVDGSLLPAVTLSGGKATIKLASLTVGTHSIAAIYSGDANDSSSTSSALTQVVNQAATSASLTTTGTPSAYGQSGSITAAVKVTSPGTGNPTGTVTFTVDGAAGTPVALSAGKAILPLASLGAGTHQVTAAYSGDGSYSGASSATLTQVVNLAATTVKLVSSKNPVSDGGAGTITATVKDVAPATGTPAGTITFTVDGVAQAPVPLSVAGLAEMLLSSLAPGSHTITAAYSGDANHAASASGQLNQVVNALPQLVHQPPRG